MIEATVPPHSPESEEYVIASVLWHKDAMAQVADILKPEHFYDVLLGRLWSACQDAFENGLGIDLPTVFRLYCVANKSEPDKPGVAMRLARIQEGALGQRNIMFHALVIAQYFISRRMIAEGSMISSESADATNDPMDIMENVQRRMIEMEESIAVKRGGSYHDTEEESLADMNKPGRAIHPTGFKELDALIGGFQGGNLFIIAARPAMGKSSFAFSCVGEAMSLGTGVGVLSLEIGQDKGQARLLSRRTGIPLAAIVRGEMTPAQIVTRQSHLDTTKNLQMWIRYDAGMTLAAIRSEAERMKRKGAKVIFIDQLNWITPPKAQNRDSEVGVITRTLKLMASQLDVDIVLLSQLNRAVDVRGGDKIPKLSDLRDSGNIEQDAQVVMFLYRPEYYGITEDDRGSTIGIVDVIVAKNSNGPTGTARLGFEPSTASMHNLSYFGNQFEHAPF